VKKARQHATVARHRF